MNAEKETYLSSRESSGFLFLYSREVVLTLCVVTSLGVSQQMCCIADIYIKILTVADYTYEVGRK